MQKLYPARLAPMLGALNAKVWKGSTTVILTHSVI